MANYTTSKIDNQIKKLAKNHKGVNIFKNKDTIVINNYKIKHMKDRWVVLQKDTVLEKFFKRSTALSWCLLEIQRKYSKIPKLLKLDRAYNRMENKLYTYEYMLKTADRKRNNFKHTLYKTLLIETRIALRGIRSQHSEITKSVRIV